MSIVFLVSRVIILIVDDASKLVVLLLYHLGEGVDLKNLLLLPDLLVEEKFAHSLRYLDDVGSTFQLWVVHHDLQAVDVVTLQQGFPLVLDHGHTHIVQVNESIQMVEEVVIFPIDIRLLGIAL